VPVLHVDFGFCVLQKESIEKFAMMVKLRFEEKYFPVGGIKEKILPQKSQH
jgi:hypothetical protein